MKYKLICEVSFPSFDISVDVTIPYNKSVYYVCEMLNKLIIDDICPSYIPKKSSILINKRTGEVYDMNVLVNQTSIKNGSKLAFY